MSIETVLDIENKLLVLNTDILRIENQITDAKYNAKKFGDYSEGEWYGKANYAVGIKKIQRKQLDSELLILKREEKLKQRKRMLIQQNEISCKNKKEKEIRMKHLGIIFMEIAREYLTDKKFQQILDKSLLITEIKKI